MAWAIQVHSWDMVMLTSNQLLDFLPAVWKPKGDKRIFQLFDADWATFINIKTIEVFPQLGEGFVWKGNKILFAVIFQPAALLEAAVK